MSELFPKKEGKKGGAKISIQFRWFIYTVLIHNECLKMLCFGGFSPKNKNIHYTLNHSSCIDRITVILHSFKFRCNQLPFSRKLWDRIKSLTSQQPLPLTASRIRPFILLQRQNKTTHFLRFEFVEMFESNPFLPTQQSFNALCVDGNRKFKTVCLKVCGCDVAKCRKPHMWAFATSCKSSVARFLI